MRVHIARWSRSLSEVSSFRGYNGNGERPSDEPTLDELLRDIHGQDADWLLGIIKFWKKSGAAGWASFIARDNGIRAGSWRSSAFYLTTLIPRTR